MYQYQHKNELPSDKIVPEIYTFKTGVEKLDKVRLNTGYLARARIT